MQSLEENQILNPEWFKEQVREHLETLLPFYRKSDPPYYPCLEDKTWHEMFSEGYGFDYRMWHIPLCLSCMNVIARFGNAFFFNPEFTLNFHISPHSLKEEGTIGKFVDGTKILPSERVPQRFSQDLQLALPFSPGGGMEYPVLERATQDLEFHLTHEILLFIAGCHFMT